MKYVIQKIITTLFYILPVLLCAAIYNSMQNKLWAVFIIALIAFVFFSVLSYAIKKGGGK